MLSMLHRALTPATAIALVVVLPATGSTVPLWIPIVGGVVLLLGAAAVVYTIVSRRRLAADAPATPPTSADEPETPPSA